MTGHLAPMTDFEEQWAFIVSELQPFFEALASGEDIEEEKVRNASHRLVWTCHFGDGDFSKIIQAHLMESMKEYHERFTLPSLADFDVGEVYLIEFLRQWEREQDLINLIISVFTQLNRKYDVGLEPFAFEELSLRLYHDIVFQNIFTSVRNSLTTALFLDRSGKPIRRRIIAEVVSVFDEIRNVTEGRYARE